MASLFETIEKGLDTWGFDLCQPFEIDDYNDNVRDIQKIPSIGREYTLGILVGNSRNLWEKFLAKLAEDDDLFRKDNPLDTYTKMAIEAVTSKLHVRSIKYYACDGKQAPFLDYQLLAEISGMCKRSAHSHMCYHHQYGHWIGLRAVIVLDHTYVYNLSTKHMVDFKICQECDEEYGRKLNSLFKQEDMIFRYRVIISLINHYIMIDPQIWRSWLALRTICTHCEYNYSYEQAIYHYSKNRKVLESEVKRYKEGIYQPDYAWLTEFNKDPDHYRLEDYPLSPFCLINLCFPSFLSLFLPSRRILQSLRDPPVLYI